MSTYYPSEREKIFSEHYQNLRKKEPFCNYRFMTDNDISALLLPPDLEIEKEFTRQLNELIPPDEDEMSIREKISRIV